MSELREPIRSRVPASDTDRQDRLDDLNPPPRHPEPRSFPELLETVEIGGSGWCDEATFACLMAVVKAAERRRQAEDEMRQREVEFTPEGWVKWRYREGVADRELRAALDRLAVHLRGDV